MCGIGGCVLGPGESPSLERLAAMRDALLHRGPDGSGIEVLGNVGLVHTRLAIVDVSDRAHQPMRHPSQDWWLSYNGEIFNHQELRRELVGESFHSGGDTETLLHSLARWGSTAIPRLNGQFAFAALDRGEQRLLLARDRFGIKPLYISRSDEGIWFASEPAALLAAGVDSSPRARSWTSIFDWTCYQDDSTLQAGIRRLSPGSCVEIAVDTLAVKTHRWYSPAQRVDRQRQTELRAYSRSRLVSELEDTLRTAVHDALMGDVEVGTFCSGGVDSSLVTALAAEVKKDLVAFGAGYRGDGGLDEGKAARRVAESLNIELDLLDVTKPSWRSGFVGATLHFGAPLATASSVTIAQMAERARSRGIKVLLTGEGADELFAGYIYRRDAPMADFLSRRQQATRALEPVLFGRPSRTVGAAVRRVKRLAPISATTGPTWSIPAGDEYDTLGAGADMAEIESAYGEHRGPRGALETKLLRDLDFTLSHLLNRMDENVMQLSVEARVPFLDPRVVDLALNLPLEARVSPWSKGILRDVARRHLPRTIAQRPKIYGMDFDAGAWIEEVANPRFLESGLFRDFFGIPSRDFSQLLELARGALRVRLWSAEVWCRSVFAGQTAAMIERELWPYGP